jgi:triacylglycerol lipase
VTSSPHRARALLTSLSSCLCAGLLAACFSPSGVGADDGTDAGSRSPSDAGLTTADAGSPQEDAGTRADDAGSVSSSMPGLTVDFRDWLAAHGYDVTSFARDDLTGGSFGGRATPGQPLTHDPVVFVHGNSDKAFGTVAGQTGWAASQQYFLQHGYTLAELYATTWGPADSSKASDQTHSKEYVMKIRGFIEAVLAYTGASHVDIISHSMGVTLARKAILGGRATDDAAGAYDVGSPLTDRVDTFVGIAGANLGLVACYETGPSSPTCAETNGFYPGVLSGSMVTARSSYLNDLLATQGYEGAFRYSLWSSVDELIGYGDIVYGTPTSRLPGQTSEVQYQSAPYGHFGLKDLTTATQLSLVRDHVVP